MKQLRLQKHIIVSAYLNRQKMIHSLKLEGYLGMPGICLSIFREKKSGTSVKNTSARITPTLSPPPIRPMVENYPMFELPTVKEHAQNLLKECA